MWAAKLPGEGARLYDAAVALSDIMVQLGIAIDGGKDSLSMAAQVSDRQGGTETVKAPGTLVISAYASCPDITKVITPDIKRPGESRLLYIDLGRGKHRLGGSALAQVHRQLGNEPPDVDDPELLGRTFRAVQSLICDNRIRAGHDRSDGGLITTILEMAFAGNCGLEIEIPSAYTESAEILPFLFSEELGLVMEYLPSDEKEIMSVLQKEDIPFSVIAKTTQEKRITFTCSGREFLNEDMRHLREIWEETSYQLDRLQANRACVEEEKKVNYDRTGPKYSLSFTPLDKTSGCTGAHTLRVAVIREEGSNSDREMASAFYHAGFDVWDITMTDLINERISLSEFRGVAFVGGFSYADVLDSAKGWAGVTRFNNKVWQEFSDFYGREDTFSLGVCNGCQLMALLGWVPRSGIADTSQPRFIRNSSGRFESRFSTVKILSNNAIMLRGMEGSVLGVWVAHGEGRAYFPDEEIRIEVLQKGLAPVRYVDDHNAITLAYPFNPNGSTDGIAALASEDGRHLAMMPHPERTFLKWQWAWMPEDWYTGLQTSPWLKLFQNARSWCEEQPSRRV